MIDKEWGNHLIEILKNHPTNSCYLNSERGIEVGKLMIKIERDLFSWRRSEPDTFWIDAQMFVKYKLSDKEIEFVMRMQPGIKNYFEKGPERNAYAEMMRGLEKLKELQVE